MTINEKGEIHNSRLREGGLDQYQDLKDADKS